MKRLHTLREHFAALKAAFDEASAHEDDSGEAIPRELWLAYHAAQRDLYEEEARLLAATRKPNPPTGSEPVASYTTHHDNRTRLL